MNLLFTVCGRAGSKGLQNKNLSLLLGYPLIYYPLSIIDLFIKEISLKKSDKNRIDVVLSSDSHELHQQSKIFSKVVNLVRPKSLSGDKISKLKVISHSLSHMEKLHSIRYDYIIDLDLTSPIRNLNDLLNCFDLIKSSKYDVVFTVTNSRRNPYFNMVKEVKKGFYNRVISSNFITRQQAPKVFDMNASIYAYKRSFLKRNIGIFQGKCGVVQMQDNLVLDIDSHEDLVYLELIANFLLETDNHWKNLYSNINSFFTSSKQKI